MKKRLVLIALFLTLTGCAQQTSTVLPSTKEEAIIQEENKAKTTELIVYFHEEDKALSLFLNDNEAAQAFLAYLPMTVQMNPLNGNELYYYMNESLPSDPSQPDKINAGDFMLFGTDCLVLFYEDEISNYSYTPLGTVENAAALRDVVFKGAIEVTFSLPYVE